MTADQGRDPADRPDPNTLPCDDCGHVWFPGERRHAYVDHDTARPEDAEVLCALCGKQRALRPAQPDAETPLRPWGRWL